MTAILDAARRYHRAGLAILPIRARHKKPSSSRWPDFRIVDDDDLTRHFTRRDVGNVGVILGEPSGGVVDVDLDTPEAIEMAPDFLPSTATFGRPSKLRSHWIYRADPIVATMQFRCPVTRAMLCEFRSTGHQTVFPPSTHESGEPIRWTPGGHVARVDGAELRAAVGRLAAAVLERRHGTGETSAVTALLLATAARWRGEPTAAPRVARPSPCVAARDRIDRIERARRYLGKLPPGGKRGTGRNGRTYHAALFLVCGFDLQEPDALALLWEFNASCDPRWREDDLLQKLRSAAKAPSSVKDYYSGLIGEIRC